MCAKERQSRTHVVVGIADADRINEIRGKSIMRENGPPEVAAVMFVEQIAESHRSGVGRQLAARRSLSHQAANSEQGRGSGDPWTASISPGAALFPS